MKQCITILLSLFVITAFPQQKIVKKQTTFSISGNKKKDKRIESYTIYNEQGQELERARLGEYLSIESYDDSLNTLNCGDMLLSGSVQFTVYDLLSRKVRKETWYMKEGQKDKRACYSSYFYNDKGQMYMEISYPGNDTAGRITGYYYDDESRVTLRIDSTFNYDFSPPREHAIRTQTEYDSQNRLKAVAEYSDKNLLSRKDYLYSNDLVTELRYTGSGDTLPGSILETKYGYPPKSKCFKSVTEKFYKEINGREDTRELYYYDEDCRLTKIEYYTGVSLEGVLIYEYEFFE